MTWREACENWVENYCQPPDYDMVDAAFLAGARWAVADLLEQRAWESSDIVCEFQKRLEEE